MRATILTLVLSLALLSTTALADVPGLISYQGTLTDDSGVALDTTVSMAFAIYTDSTGGGKVWYEIQPAVVVSQGLFNVLLGRVNPIPDTVFDWLTCWLSVSVGSDPELQPRQRIVSTAYSFRAAEADTADYARSATAASDGDWTISGPNMYSAVAGNVGIGTAAPEEKLHVNYGNIQISGDDDYNLSFIFDDEDTGNEFSIIGHDHLKLSTNGTARLAISTAGDVGIGTTLPSARLHVVGSGGNYGYLGHSGYGVYGNSSSGYAVYGSSSGGFGVHGYSGGSYGTGGSHSSGNSGYLGTSTYGAVGSHSSGNYGRLGTSSEGVYGNSSSGWGVHGYSSTGCGVYGSHSSGNYGYIGTSSYGVYGGSSSGRGVWGNSTSGYGVYGSHGGGNYGYLGSGSYGVYGGSSSGRGVYGATASGYGVYGTSSSGYSVYGSHGSGPYGYLGSGNYGVYGYSSSIYGVYGSSSSGYGVRGYSGTGYGVFGSHSSGNYGYLGGDDYAVYGSDLASGNIGILGGAGYGVTGHYGGALNYGGIGGSDKGVYGTSIDGYGVYGISSSGYGVYGITGGGWGVCGDYSGGNYGYIGTSQYAVYGDLVSTSPGDYAVFGYGVDYFDENGTGYVNYQSLGGVKGYNLYGNTYTFATAGYSWLDSVRSGACFGGDEYCNVWGCYAYKSSAGSEYGGYATSWGGNGGKDQASTGIGFGSWGDLFGADIHGKIYGIYAEGGNYSLYSHGTVFKDELDVHLQHMEDQSTSVLYTNVSTDVTVQTSGFATLVGGKNSITFDENFTKAVSPEVPIVVTVTPTGNSNGVYVSEVTKDGFTVLENNGGKSNVTVTFIAIGGRVGYEDPQLPVEVISSDYVDKLSRGLHNDADTETDGEGLYYQDGQLYVGMHSSVLPDPNRRREESEEMKKRRREMLKAQERERLERERMEQEVSRLEEERVKMLELQQEESLERARLEEEARRIEEEQRTRLEVEEKQSR